MPRRLTRMRGKVRKSHMVARQGEKSRWCDSSCAKWRIEGCTACNEVCGIRMMNGKTGKAGLIALFGIWNAYPSSLGNGIFLSNWGISVPRVKSQN